MTTVSTMAALQAALLAAPPGAVISLAPGIYADHRLRGIAAAGVTVTSTDPKNRAVMADLNLQASKGITFKGLLFDGQTQAETFGWMVTGCEDIAFEGCEFRDLADGDPQDADQGLKLSQSKRVRIDGCEFHHLYRAVIADNIDELQVTRSDFHDMARTSIFCTNIAGGLIAENSFRDAFPIEGDHMDAITFNVVAKPNQTRDIVVRDNLARRGKGRVTQGIVFNSKDAGNPFRNIVISGNAVLGLGLNGIYVQQVIGGEAIGNTIRRYPGRLDNSSGVVLQSQQFKVGGNTAQLFSVSPAANGNTDCEELAPAVPPSSVPDLTSAEEEALAAAWRAKFRAPAVENPVEPEAPSRDGLREILAQRVDAKLEPLKTKGRLIVNFKTPAQGEAALAAVLAVGG